MFRKYVLPLILFVIYRLLSWSWRVQISEPDSLRERLAHKQPFTIAHWHGDELMLLSLVKRYRGATMTSTSKDGELITTLIHFLGGKTSRGSSTRGGVSALKGLLRLVRGGCNPVVAVDGPKGPIYKAKPGVFEISRVTGSPIYPIAMAASRGWTFHKSWNKAFLPYPFAQVQVVWAEALGTIERNQDPRAPELAHGLEAALHAARQQAGQLLIASD